MMSDKLFRQWHSSTNALASEILIELYQHRQKQQQQSQRLPRHRHLNDDAATALYNDDGIISSFSQKWYDKIVHHYNEPHRAYHNLIHVKDVLASIDALLDATTTTTSTTTFPDYNHDHASMMEKSNAIFTLAAFFHDVIYNPKSSTNERDSAYLFLEFASELISCVVNAASILGKECKEDNDDDDEIIRQSIDSLLGSKNTMITHIEQCILATATHISSANQARQSNNYIVATFLDADMSILGRDSIRYDNYAASIRKEYGFVEKSQYCDKRAEILESFLPLMMNTDEADAITSTRSATLTQSIENDMKSKMKERHHNYIYATDGGRALWEDRARLNLRREIDMLRRGVIQCER